MHITCSSEASDFEVIALTASVPLRELLALCPKIEQNISLRPLDYCVEIDVVLIMVTIPQFESAL